MEETLTQPCRVQDEGLMGRKLLLFRNKLSFVNETEGTKRISTG